MLEWKKAVDGSWVPSEQGLLLASGHNPKKEASAWCDRYKKRIEESESLVVLGLGGGYHIRELHERYSDLRIVVIEKNSELVSQVVEKTGALPQTAGVFSPKRPGLLASELDVQDVLSSVYGLLRYSASIRPDPDYYHEVALWLMARSSEGLRAQINLRPKLREFFEGTPGLFAREGKSPNILEIENAIRARGFPLDRVDMTWLALRELVV
jgi:hypothetical protein